jgi:hypothetical protein
MTSRAVPWSLRLAYATELLVDLFIDFPLFTFRPLQSQLLPSELLTPELRLIAQAKGTSNLVVGLLVFLIGTRHAPSTEVGRTVARVYILHQAMALALAAYYGLVEPTRFEQKGAAIVTHAVWLGLGVHGLFSA